MHLWSEKASFNFFATNIVLLMEHVIGQCLKELETEKLVADSNKALHILKDRIVKEKVNYREIKM